MNLKKGQINANNVQNTYSSDITTIKTALSLQNVDNTSDADKPISTATQTALDNKQAVLSEGAFVDGDKTKLDTIESGAEVNTINDLVQGTNVTIDKTDPLNPIIVRRECQRVRVMI